MKEETEVSPPVQSAANEEAFIEIFGAREHNLKNFDVSIPRNKLVVFTGISGSGKSSLAFDTIYAEGQRRYMESFSAYARSFIGEMERPDVDKIEGLSPVISIEQKTTSKNPRSTVGTVTEIYDFMRLLFARAGEAYSYVTGKKMARQTEDQIIDQLIKRFEGRKIIVLAPMVRGRKGHYRELFQQIRKSGYQKVRIDGEIAEITPKMQVDRYKIHDIEVVVDRLIPGEEDRYRLTESVKTALNYGKGLIFVQEYDKAGEEGLHYFSRFLMCPDSGISYEDPAPNVFSFNSPYGWCSTCKGLGVVHEINQHSIIPDHNLSISRGGIAPIGEYRDIWIFRELQQILKAYSFNLSIPVQKLSDEVLDVILYGTQHAATKGRLPAFEGIINYLNRQRKEGSEKIQEWVNTFTEESTCPDCEGQRLKKEARHFKIDDKNISELSHFNLSKLASWFENIEERLGDKQKTIAAPVLAELRKRIGFLLDVGLYYLDLDRPVRTLSGGESQRIRLATQVGTQLVGVLYILDEPSIGLHQRDNHRLLHSLKQLRDAGNTVIVVEHDRETMLESDYILDIGPGAGVHGGHIVASGTPGEVMQQGSYTADFLKGSLTMELKPPRVLGDQQYLTLKGASGHNLKNIDFTLPLGKMTCVTGVSGSGKSSLIHNTLFPVLKRNFYRSRTKPLPYSRIDGLNNLDKVIEIDQKPIGRTPRSNPATYTGVFADIRNLFVQMPEAKIRGYKPARFSFNVKGGRCETCQGGGMRVIEMDFLPDVQVPCETCKGKRYNRETLEVRFKGKSIADVLEMTVDQAVEFFDNQPRILRYVKVLQEVGLGYITLGQHATTLSGGEAQRVKLASELVKRDTGKTLYILDEPTTGLHFYDIKHLLSVLNQLVDKGNTVLIIEHNMDVIKAVDHIIDLGPEGGEKGGKLIDQGTPEEVAGRSKGYTGEYLSAELKGA